MGGRVPCGVTAHGNPIGPLQFDRLEVAPAARRETQIGAYRCKAPKKSKRNAVLHDRLPEGNPEKLPSSATVTSSGAESRINTSASSHCAGSIEACQARLARAELSQLQLKVAARRESGFTLARNWLRASQRPMRPGR